MTRIGRPIPVTVANNGDGTFSVSYFPDRVGWYNVHIKLSGRKIKSAPFDVLMAPPTLELVESNFATACMNEEIEFSLDPEDTMVLVDPSNVQVTIKDPRGFPIAPEDIDVSKGAARGRRDGRITYQYMPTEPGVFLLDCSIYGISTRGFPIACMVAPKQGALIDIPWTVLDLRVGFSWRLPVPSEPREDKKKHHNSEPPLQAECCMMRYTHEIDHVTHKEPADKDGAVYFFQRDVPQTQQGSFNGCLPS